MNRNIPDIVIGRLPLYLRALSYMAEMGLRTTSSHDLGRRLGISSAQIRKDLSHFGEFGKQGTGYTINHLTEELRKILKLDDEWGIVLIGAGYLGHAISHYQGFEHRGFSVRWVFDCDPNLIGKTMNGMMVYHIDELSQRLQNEQIKVALIAIPATKAQFIADLLIENGIRAILNYAPINLDVPENVQVSYSDPVVQLQHMTYYLD